MCVYWLILTVHRSTGRLQDRIKYAGLWMCWWTDGELQHIERSVASVFWDRCSANLPLWPTGMCEWCVRGSPLRSDIQCTLRRSFFRLVSWDLHINFLTNPFTNMLQWFGVELLSLNLVPRIGIELWTQHIDWEIIMHIK